MSGVCAASALHPCAGKQTLAAVSTSWRQARAETAGTTVNVAGLAVAVLQLEMRPAARTAASLGFDGKNWFATMMKVREQRLLASRR